jgi:hypothetical protein
MPGVKRECLLPAPENSALAKIIKIAEIKYYIFVEANQRIINVHSYKD